MKRMHPRRTALTIAACLAAGSSAHAADSDITTSFSGYGTVGATFTDDGATQFIPSSALFRGATDRIDIGLESRLGLQGVVRFTPQLSFTAQGLAQRRGDKDFDIGAEWLYGQYTPMEGVDLRLGRVLLPVFLMSDSRYVGYAQPWFRAPTDVYSGLPFSSLDGVQASWRKSLGPVVVTAQLSYGSTSADVQTAVGAIHANAHDVVNVSLAAEYGSWTLRAARTTLNAPVSLPISATASIDYTNHDHFMDVGLQFDNGHAIAIAEWVKRTENDVPGLGMPISASAAWYAAAGWRFGDFTPMATYSTLKDNGALIHFVKSPVIGASLRYDVARNVALKLQVDRYDASNNAFQPAATATGKKVDVIGLGADFVF